MLYCLLLAVALAANRSNRHMLLLVAVIAASWFAEAPRSSYEAFYAFCIAVELSVAGVALWLRTNASATVALICAAMLLVHIAAFFADTYPPLSPSRLIIPALEHAEVVACIVLSNPLIGRIRNYESSTY